ncbi:hypothetical protein ACH5RR_001118 [Cinchona calisaya]|uniref:Uncharacterized protein n=1 Tax=Cinchona calisaya TaxID=153742 RepID=A0ABD3B2H8_9GENT
MSEKVDKSNENMTLVGCSKASTSTLDNASQPRISSIYGIENIVIPNLNNQESFQQSQCFNFAISTPKITNKNGSRNFSNANTVIYSQQTKMENPISTRERCKKEIDILEDIAEGLEMLKEVSDYPYCGAKRFEYEPPGFYCSSGEIHLLY